MDAHGRQRPADRVTVTPPVEPSPTGTTPTRRRSEVFVVTVASLVIGSLVLICWFPRIAVPDSGPEPLGLISRLYDPPSRSIERALNIGDGQVYATQAVDPLALRDDLLRGGAQEQAYRYQRGAYGWIGWVASGGRTGPVPWALAVVTWLSAGLLVAVTAEVIRRQGGPPFAALLLVLTPGVITNLLFIGPEVLGTALLVAAVARWRHRPGSPLAIAAFAAAGLCRESFLLVPIVFGAYELLERRPRTAVRAGLAAVPFLLWVLYLRVGVGAWPRGTTGGRLSLVPFAGLIGHEDSWGLDDIAGLTLTVGLGVVGLVRARDRVMRAVFVAHLALSATFGAQVWSGNYGTGRVLLPIAVLGLIELARPSASHEASEEPCAPVEAAERSVEAEPFAPL